MAYHELLVKIEVVQAGIPLDGEEQEEADIQHEKHDQNDVSEVLLCIQFESMLMLQNCSYVA